MNDTDLTCPACLKISSVRRLTRQAWCADCDLGFVPGDHTRVSNEWRTKYRARRDNPPELVAPQTPPRTIPVCATCRTRHTHQENSH